MLLQQFCLLKLIDKLCPNARIPVAENENDVRNDEVGNAMESGYDFGKTNINKLTKLLAIYYVR